MRIASSEFADDPCSSVKRGTMVRAARALLSAVTRLLILADMADVMRLLSHLKIVRAIITLYSAKRNVLLQQHSAVFLPVDMALWPYRVMKPCQLVSYVVLELQSEVWAGTLQILVLTYPTCFEVTPEIFLQVVVLSVYTRLVCEVYLKMWSDVPAAVCSPQKQYMLLSQPLHTLAYRWGMEYPGNTHQIVLY